MNWGGSISRRRTGAGKIFFVCQQAAARMPELPLADRLHLLEGLQLMLPQAEFEQCKLIEQSLREREIAAQRAEDAQLILGDMLSDREGGK